MIIVHVALLEMHMRKQSPSRIEELVQIFIRATQLEIKFWDLDAHWPSVGMVLKKKAEGSMEIHGEHTVA